MARLGFEPWQVWLQGATAIHQLLYQEEALAASPLPREAKPALPPPLAPVSLHAFPIVVSAWPVSPVPFPASRHAHPTASGCPLMTLGSQLEAGLDSPAGPRHCAASFP